MYLYQNYVKETFSMSQLWKVGKAVKGYDRHIFFIIQDKIRKLTTN